MLFAWQSRMFSGAKDSRSSRRRTAPGLILLDLTMPIMSGREMIRVLQGYVRFSMIPVLIMTSEVPLAVSPEEGTVGRLQKPFSSDQLLAHVRQYVRPTPVDE
jgi:FixJ family two-component response regulator